MASTTVSPFHAGEQAVQERLGVRETIEPWAKKAVRTWMPDQHREFYEQLPFIVAAARDDEDRPWVTLLTGGPGFIQSPDSQSLIFDAQVLAGDALDKSLNSGTELGLLGIELDTRRRNRVNGTLVETESNFLRFQVGQSFGNCPQYITEREWQKVERPRGSSTSSRSSELTQSMQRWIGQADTFFIGSGHSGAGESAANGMDASHRGGPKGFIKVESSSRLIFPDYSGNNHFNTIGNLVLDPRVGLLFVDFDSGSLLQVTGNASIDWESPEVARHTGAQRLIIVDVLEVVEVKDALPLRFTSLDSSGRSLKLADKQKESVDVTSFYFVAEDGKQLPDFEAGQHLPIELQIDGERDSISRTYSLSNGPAQGYYRISVKRETKGLASRLLHDSLEVGSVIKSRTPAGDFVVGHHNRPVVLISAGVGVTPMLSMLHELTATPSDRPITFLHGARDGAHHNLASEIQILTQTNGNVASTTAYSQPLSTDVRHKNFDLVGRLDANIIRENVPNLNAEFYLCGPPLFMTGITDALSELGVSENHIHVEEF